ncbi:hypothetical protein CO151_08245 [bacterium CG_4_9_14_3_um_filter_65_15]|nr:MAG: hypothetical protein CO151_08245 [bacterium CG_4_9_14_3_um_filter_65_15]
MGPLSGTVRSAVAGAVLLLLLTAGCAKYNTFFNAERAFDNAEQVREEALKRHEDPPEPSGQQKANYEIAIRKAQKILDDFPGHSLTDDALFLQAKAYHRLASYRMSIRKLDLLFSNFPQTEYQEEALYLQGLNYLLIGSLAKSQEYLDRLAKLFPKSRYQAETRKVVGDNAFTMQDWNTAYDSYREYLAQDNGVQNPDQVGLKLGECCWELKRFSDGVPVLDYVIENTLSPEMSFRAKLLKVRMLTRMNEFAEANALIGEIKPEAEIFQSEGMVALAEAKNLFAQGEGEVATPLLQNLPDEWKTAEVRAGAADLLGYSFLNEGKWALAREQFKTALAGKRVLEDQERTRRLSGNLQDYLAAEAALKDASGEKVPRLKLLEANALLFGLGRPRQAAELYMEATADTNADPGDAARALYGAILAYRDHLDRPDSADIFAASLQERFPDSPQAFMVASDPGDRDLLGMLLDRQRRVQADSLAALSPEQRAALVAVGSEWSPAIADRSRKGTGLRRRMVYLSRRENLVYPPPERGPQMGPSPGRNPVAAADSLGLRPQSTLPESVRPEYGRDLPVTLPDSSALDMASGIDTVTVPEPEPEKKVKKNKSDGWDYLRSPGEQP